MLPRRTLLAAALAVCGAGAVGGCALAPPGAPVTPLESPTPEITPGHRALLGLHSMVAAAPPTQALTWCAGVLDEHLAALGLAPPPPAVSSSDVDAVRAALAAATPLLRARVMDDRTADPLAWASMAAWTRGAVAVLAQDAPLLEATRTRLSPAAADPAAALGALVTTTDQVRFALEVAAGTPGLPARRVDAVRARLAAWAALRRAVADALAELPGSTVPPVEPAWGVERPVNAEAARALIARTEAAALPALGRALASGPDALRPTLADALVAGAGVLPAWGATLPRWPGYPT